MSEFRIDVGNVRNVVSNQKEVVNILSTCENMIRISQNQLPINNSSTILKKHIKELAQQVTEEKQRVKGCYSALNTIIVEYQKTENELVNVGGAKKSTISNTSNASKNTEDSKSDVPKWVKNMWKIVGKAGPVGKGLKTIGSFATDVIFGTVSAQTIANASSDLWGTGWDIGKKVKKLKQDSSSVTWKEWMGFSSGTLGKIAHSNLGMAERATHGAASVWKNTIREFNSTSGRIKQIGGIALAGVINGFSNYDEYATKYREGKVTKEYAVGRAVLETIGETAVDWGKNILIGSAVAAGFAAAGVAAPAVAVGAATVGISIGVDWVCKKVTKKIGGEEKGLTELVSDTIIDAGEKIVKAKVDMVSSIWSGLNKGYMGIKNGFKFA